MFHGDPQPAENAKTKKSTKPAVKSATAILAEQVETLRQALEAQQQQLKQLQEENGKLKKLVAELSLDKAMLQDVLSKKF